MRLGDRWIVIVAIVLGACGGGGDSAASPEPPSRRGIQFISGNNVTDTTDAVLSQALVVEVRDSAGRLAPMGTLVRFSALRTNHIDVYFEVLVQHPASAQFSEFASVATDAAGRSAILLKLGFVAGPARVAISVPTLGVTDTARFTILPGAPVSFAITPPDTALYVGRTYTLRGGVTDYNGNLRSDPITWTASDPGIAVTNAGVVSAARIGRYTITATAGTRTGRVGVSVVPQGRIAALQLDTTSRIVAVDLDGSNFRDLAASRDWGLGAYPSHPSWIPGSNTIVYSHFEGSLQALYTVDETRAVKPLFSALPPNVTHQAEPTPSANGQWMYFSAHNTQCGRELFCLHRSRIDGSALEVLGNVIQPALVNWRPAPSPDGGRVAFGTVSQIDRSVIKVLDVATRTVSSWSVLGSYPRWSPNGAVIAFVQDGGGPIMLVNPDGSGERRLSELGRTFVQEPISWSPDSRWIIARSAASLNLVDAITGAVLPLPYLRGLYAPSLK